MSVRDELDRTLDEALATYGDPGPDGGLEQRVLARIGSERQARHHRWPLRWAAGLAAAAGLVLAITPALWHPARPHTAPKPGDTPIERPLIARAGAPKLQRPADWRPRHAAGAARSSGPQPVVAPKLDIFPTPVPLSSQEKALVRLIARTPAEQRKKLMAPPEQTNEPPSIAAISIPPIEPPTEGKE
jgi:hypothetical protein